MFINPHRLPHVTLPSALHSAIFQPYAIRQDASSQALTCVNALLLQPRSASPRHQAEPSVIKKLMPETPVSEMRRLRTALRRHRDALGLTQREVADALEWSLSKMIRIEKGPI